MTETIVNATTDPADVRTRAGASVEGQRLVELQRVARDAASLAAEFLTTHVRLCGCNLCRHWAAAAGGPTATAARKLLRTVESLVKVGAAIGAGVAACGPDPTGCDRPHELTRRGIERARRRLAASRACADPKSDGPTASPTPIVPCG